MICVTPYYYSCRNKKRNERKIILICITRKPSKYIKRGSALCTLHLKNTGRNTKMIVSLEGKLHGVWVCVCLWDAAKWNSAYRESDTRSKWIEENKGLRSPRFLLLCLLPVLWSFVLALFFFVHFSLSCISNSGSQKAQRNEHINTNTYCCNKKSQIMSDIFCPLSLSLCVSQRLWFSCCPVDAALTVKQWPPEDS